MMICILYHLACTLEIFKWSKKKKKEKMHVVYNLLKYPPIINAITKYLKSFKNCEENI